VGIESHPSPTISTISTEIFGKIGRRYDYAGSRKEGVYLISIAPEKIEFLNELAPQACARNQLGSQNVAENQCANFILPLSRIYHLHHN
jgi:hypothetical protein